MALSYQGASEVVSLSASAGSYMSVVVDVGLAPKAICVLIAGKAGDTERDKEATHVVVGGFSLTLRRQQNYVAGSSSGCSQVWTLDSSVFVGLLTGNQLVEVWRAADTTSSTAIVAICAVLNSDTWAAYLVSNETNNANVAVVNPSVSLAMTGLPGWAFAALHSTTGVAGNVTPGAGFTMLAQGVYNTRSYHFERLTAQSAGPDITAGFTHASLGVGLTAAAFREIAVGVLPEPIRPFKGHVGALATTVAFAGLVDQNNNPVSPTNGDVCIVLASTIGPGNPAPPALPANWTNRVSGTASGTGDDAGYRVGTLIYNGETDIGIWTAATEVLLLVYHYNRPVNIIGDIKVSVVGSAGITLPALVPQGVDGLSYVVTMGVVPGSTVEAPRYGFPGTVPAEGAFHQFVNRTPGNAATRSWAADSNGYLNVFAGGITANEGGVAVLGLGISIELLSVEPYTLAGVWRWLIVDGELPPGLTMAELTGILSGTPTQVGTYNFTYVETDGISSSPPFPCQITIQGPINQVGAVSPDTSWSFDVGRFRTEGAAVWHRHNRVMRRPTQVGRTRILYVGADPEDGEPDDNVVQELDKEGVIADGYWTTGTLNRKNSAAQYTITRMVFRYEAAGVDIVEVEASGNGGLTWVPCLSRGFSTVDSLGQIRRAHVAFNVTGYDLRVRVKLPEDTLVRILRGRPEIIERGEL